MPEHVPFTMHVFRGESAVPTPGVSHTDASDIINRLGLLILLIRNCLLLSLTFITPNFVS